METECRLCVGALKMTYRLCLSYREAPYKPYIGCMRHNYQHWASGDPPLASTWSSLVGWFDHLGLSSILQPMDTQHHLFLVTVLHRLPHTESGPPNQRTCVTRQDTQMLLTGGVEATEK
jgi:hypothetical protein